MLIKRALIYSARRYQTIQSCSRYYPWGLFVTHAGTQKRKYFGKPNAIDRTRTGTKTRSKLVSVDPYGSHHQPIWPPWKPRRVWLPIWASVWWASREAWTKCDKCFKKIVYDDFFKLVWGFLGVCSEIDPGVQSQNSSRGWYLAIHIHFGRCFGVKLDVCGSWVGSDICFKPLKIFLADIFLISLGFLQKLHNHLRYLVHIFTLLLPQVLHG